MAAATTEVMLWQNLSTGLSAVHQFGKLIQVLSLSWDILQKFLKRSQREKVEVKKLRKDLLVIARALREAHFAIGEHDLLPSEDFLAKELATVLEATEKACADPRLYELQVVMEKAAFVQTRLMTRLETLASTTAMPASQSQHAGPLRQALARLSANSLMVSQALQADSSSEFPRSFEPKFPELFRATSAATEDYDSAAESETEWNCELSDDDDDGYQTCDEIAFWDEAHSYWVGRQDSSLQPSDGDCDMSEQLGPCESMLEELGPI